MVKIHREGVSVLDDRLQIQSLRHPEKKNVTDSLAEVHKCQGTGHSKAAELVATGPFPDIPGIGVVQAGHYNKTGCPTDHISNILVGASHVVVAGVSAPQVPQEQQVMEGQVLSCGAGHWQLDPSH